jgi:HSP20 family protein
MIPPNRVDELRRDLDRLFNAFDAGLPRRAFARATGYPAMNIWDAGDRLCVEAELPGVNKDDLEILAVGNELTIKGKRGPVEGQWTYHRHERGVGEFARSITLPSEVDAGRVEAVMNDGVLRIHLPKAEAAKPRQITVKTA